ncbi:MAG: phage capsid protein [Clostridia bacterium]|nr:phage capsid protein [Clostridia bacterium]
MNIFSLKNSLSALGIEAKLSEQMSAALSEWDRLYREKDGLSLASAIASETARLTTIEFKSEISGSGRAAFLEKQYKDFIANIRNITELACAKGGVVLKPYMADGSIKVSCIQAENFIPTEFNSSGDIVGAAFLDRHFSGGKVYTRIEQHGFDGDAYIIRNFAFVGDNASSLGRAVSLQDVPAWRDIEPYVAMAGIKKPLFVYFKMPMANCIDTNSPLGVSVFARVASLIGDAEAQYKRLLWEFESGERALYVDEAAMHRDSSGECVVPDRRLYRLLNSGDDTLFEDWTPTLRDESIINGLNEILRRIEFNSGLAYGTLSNVLNIDRTAEEIRVSKQRSYAHVCDIQDALRTALTALVDAMNTITDLYCLAEDGQYGISFEFDDSIVADRKTEFEEKLRLCQEGIIEPWEVRAWYFGEDEETAKKRSCMSAHAPQKENAGGKV